MPTARSLRGSLLAPVAVGLAACSSHPLPLDAASDAPADARSDALADAATDASPRASDLPLIPVGYDALRQWDRLPYVRIGARAYLRSTYDRDGANAWSDASHFLRQRADGALVALDVAGTGVLYFARANHWHGSPWHYGVDGGDTIVRESSTADPDHPVANSVFLPAASFPSPLACTWSATRGADLSWVPIAFQQSFQLAYERTHYGTGYFVFEQFAPGTEHLSQPLASWDPSAAPPADVLALLGRAGEDLAPTGDGVALARGTADVPATGAVTLAELRDGPSTLRALRLTVPRAQALAFSDARVRITWDARDVPSVDAPAGLLFGAGTLYNRDGREFLVKGLLANVRYDATTVQLALYYPMPYQRSARVELVGAGRALAGVGWELRAVPYRDPASWVGYFHATFRDHGTPVAGHDLVLLDTTQQEGGGDWCGSFAGTAFTFSDRASLGTLEGDPRFFFDDSGTPQGQGTGTEEWAGGGDYWGGQNMTLPFAGHPTGAPSAGAGVPAEDLVEGAYRFLLADAMPFGRNARIQLEHGGADDSTEHYRTVTYWYGRPGACLVRTDALHVGDPDDEARHGYASPTAGPVETLTSRYELGVDHVGNTEIYPAITDTGRSMAGASEFVVRLDPANVGVLLRRRLDYGYPDQRAEVSVADDRDGAPFVPAGVWYTAGAYRTLGSNPPGELDPPALHVETSNRRFRDDEFLLPRRLTEGRASVRVRVTFTPTMPRLFPADPAQPQRWSEYRYWAYSYVLPAGG